MLREWGWKWSEPRIKILHSLMRLYLPIVSHWKQKFTLTLVSEKEVYIGSYRICQQSIPLSADTLNSHFNQAAEIIKITENAEKWIWKHELQIRFNCFHFYLITPLITLITLIFIWSLLWSPWEKVQLFLKWRRFQIHFSVFSVIFSHFHNFTC